MLLCINQNYSDIKHITPYSTREDIMSSGIYGKSIVVIQ